MPKTTTTTTTTTTTRKEKTNKSRKVVKLKTIWRREFEIQTHFIYFGDPNNANKKDVQACLVHATNCVNKKCPRSECLTMKRMLRRHKRCLKSEKKCKSYEVIEKILPAHIPFCKAEPQTCNVPNCPNSIRVPTFKLAPKSNRRLRQDQIRLFHLCHASKCEGECRIKNCSKIKKLWQHVVSCHNRKNKNCTVLGCRTSKILATHYVSCWKPFCALCTPAKNLCEEEAKLWQKKRNASSGAGTSKSNSNGEQR